MVKSNESEIENISGFKIEAVLRARLSPITRNKIYDYIAHTSVVNPYAQLSFESNEGRILFERRTTVLPSAAKEVLPHPIDMDLKTLKKAISNFDSQKITLHGCYANHFRKCQAKRREK